MMIRAGRRKFAQTSDELAAAMGLKIGTFRNKKPYDAEEFPAAISSDKARVRLWDREQTAAFLAGSPVPELPSEDDDQDLLDRNEAAAELRITPKTWDDYKTHPQIAPHLVDVKGVEHCPRGIVTAFRSSKEAGPGRKGNPGRPPGSWDAVPRDLIASRVAALLDDDPAVTVGTVQDALGLAWATSVRTLSRLRGQRIADLLETEPEMAPEAAAERLGYPAAVRRAALAHAAVELRVRRILPYLQHVADTLASAGLADVQSVEVRTLGDEVLAAAVVLNAAGPAAALVWDERYGWRTAVSRRHPIGKETSTPPEGDGIRYLSEDQQPTPAELLAALADGRLGSRRPGAVHAVGGEHR
ncbi:DUF6292 family protein [Streptomyces sp. NPDC057199]|uniref:DUF6292 family protein n=1 Tax=Streptomyces sp. NPDC057199 TaxID=3346047 RepID=UPI003638408E